jgi:hypothetical protein
MTDAAGFIANGSETIRSQANEDALLRRFPPRND